ncbi:MAG: pyruvate dehydrogenase, partial [Chloroflexi bacterium]|nr:pyruvate dehydrogenase [Chloroflexota bacterium]
MERRYPVHISSAIGSSEPRSGEPDLGSGLPVDPAELAALESIQRRVLWLASAIIHHANHRRPNPEQVKVGGHQASSASVVSILTALYLVHLRPGDRVSIKPHASPVFHAIQYLLGNLDCAHLPTLRAFHGLQAYPSRTKDPDPIDFSTGSVGLGAVAPAFAALAQRYADLHFDRPLHRRRFIAVVGDAELDEGVVWEAVAEDQLRGLDNVLWIVDLNRQSLDRVVPGIRARQLEALFADSRWHVLEVKYGRRLQAAFARPGGSALRQCIDDMSNEEYQALIRRPGADIRQRLLTGPDGVAVGRAVDHVPDAELPGLLTDLGGHDLAELLACFATADQLAGAPAVIFAYTIKGWGLPFAGDPLNHSALLTEAQFADLRLKLGADPTDDWAAFPPDSPEARLCARAAARLRPDPAERPMVLPAKAIPTSLDLRVPPSVSSQEAFGRLLVELHRVPRLGERIVTASPDVAISTSLGGWVNRTGVFASEEAPPIPVAGERLIRWQPGPRGQHLELGISEMNLFMLLGQFGLAVELIGEHLFPIGTVYDPFILRGLDALIHALYSATKMIVVGTPSGITLSPEGGAHQSTATPSLGIALPNLIAWEPCFAREVEWILLEALRECCDRAHGRSSYLRLSTRPIDQQLPDRALARLGEETLRRHALAGGYRLVDWRDEAPDLSPDDVVQIVVAGASAPEAVAAARLLHSEGVAAN